MKKINLLLIIFGIICTMPVIGIADVGPNWIEQYGIRWTFDKNISLNGAGDTYRYGQFVNGDYWIIGPVRILSITPQTRVTGEGELDPVGRVLPTGASINGTQINPRAGVREVGYFSGDQMVYSSNLNAAIDIDSKIIPINSSVISTITGMTQPGLHHVISTKTAAVLTVLPGDAFSGLPAGITPQDCFRPGYAGLVKRIYHTQGLFERANTILKSYTPVPNTPDITEWANRFRQPFIQHRGGWDGHTIFPLDALNPDASAYGREFQRDVGIAALLLNLDSDVLGDKKDLMLGVIQSGIDLASVVLDSLELNKNKSVLAADGGHYGGRRLPIFMAARLLDEPDLKGILQRSGWNYLTSPKLDMTGNPIPGEFYGPGGGWDCPLPDNSPSDYIAFGEEQFFYVTQLEVDLSNRNGPYGDVWRYDTRSLEFIPYTSSYIGIPDWTGNHRMRPHSLNAYGGTLYRAVVSCAISGNALAILMMDGKELWNHDPFLDYADRWMHLHALGNEWSEIDVGWRTNNRFTELMWDEYRESLTPVWSGDEPQTQYDLNIFQAGKSELRVLNNVIKSKENTHATIICNMSTAGRLSVTIYDARGREIIVLCDEDRNEGVQQPIFWDGADASGKKVGSGVYMVHMRAGSYKETKKIVVVR